MVEVDGREWCCAAAGASAETLASISTPDRVESRLGTLEFHRHGAPSEATAQLLYDHLDFVHGVQAFINAFPGASVEAMRQGFLSIGVEDNSVLLFSELMRFWSVMLYDRQTRSMLQTDQPRPDVGSQLCWRSGSCWCVVERLID